MRTSLAYSTRISVWLVAGALALAGCTDSGDPDPGDFDTVSSDHLRITDPDVSAGDMQALVAGNTAFALDLYQQLAAGHDGNLFYSPLSISLALAMTYAGARTETAAEMADTLSFTLEPDRLHPAFDALDLELASRETPPDEYADDGFHLKIANSIWGQTGYPFETPFLDVLAENYGAGLNLLDYATVPEECRATINAWVEDNTAGKILDLLPAGSITTLTRLVLTNAVYFKAAWNDPFDPADTATADFHRADESTVAVDMMNEVSMLPYGDGDGYQAVELPYDGEQLSMVVLVPDAGTLDTFAGALTPSSLDAILDGMSEHEVTLGLPKFSFDFGLSLEQTLQAMGMQLAFTFDSDFTGMTTVEDVRISDVIHKAFVGVDEEGTEAAAATAVIMEGGSGPPEPASLTVDRPFLFLIRDRPTGSILFVGRVVDPSA